MPIIRDHPLIPGAQYMVRLPSEPRFEAAVGVAVSVELDQTYIGGLGTGTRTFTVTIRARDIAGASIVAGGVALSVVPTNAAISFGALTSLGLIAGDYVFTSVVTVTLTESPAVEAVTSQTILAAVTSSTGRYGRGSGRFYYVTTRPGAALNFTATAWVRGIRLTWETPATSYVGDALATNAAMAYYLIRKARVGAAATPTLDMTEAKALIAAGVDATGAATSPRVYAVTGNAFVDPEAVATVGVDTVRYYYWLVSVDLFANFSALAGPVDSLTGFVLDADIVAGAVDIARIAARNTAATAVAAGTVTATKVGVVNVAFDPALIFSHHRLITGTLTPITNGQYYQSIAWKDLWLVIGESPVTATYNPADGELFPAPVSGAGTVTVTSTLLTFSQSQDGVLDVGYSVIVGANSYLITGRSSGTVWSITGGVADTAQPWSYVFADHAVVWDKSASAEGELVLLPRATYQASLAPDDVLLGFNLGGEFVPSMAGTVIRGDTIETGTILADKLDVNELSAITANLGTITTGIILDNLATPQSVLRLSSTLARAIVQNQYGQPLMASSAAVAGTIAVSGGTATFSVSQVEQFVPGDAILAGGQLFTIVSGATTSWTVTPSDVTVSPTSSWVVYRMVARLIDMPASASRTLPLVPGDVNRRFISVTRLADGAWQDLIYITAGGDAKFTGDLQATTFNMGTAVVDPAFTTVGGPSYSPMRVLTNAYFGGKFHAIEAAINALYGNSARFNGLKVSSTSPVAWPTIPTAEPTAFASLGQYSQAPAATAPVAVTRRAGTGTASVATTSEPAESTGAVTLSTLDNTVPTPVAVPPAGGSYLLEVKPAVQVVQSLGDRDALPVDASLTIIVQKRDGSSAPWSTVATRNFTYNVAELFDPDLEIVPEYGLIPQGWTYVGEGNGHAPTGGNFRALVANTPYTGTGTVGVSGGTATFTTSQTFATGEWFRAYVGATPYDFKVTTGGSGLAFSVTPSVAVSAGSAFDRFTTETSFTVPITSYSGALQPEIRIKVSGSTSYDPEWNPLVTPELVTFGDLIYEINAAFISFDYLPSGTAVTREDSVAALGGYLYLKPISTLAAGIPGELVMYTTDGGATASPRYHDGLGWQTLGSGSPSGVSSFGGVTGAITLGSNLAMSGSQLTLSGVALTGHVHAIADVTGLQTALDGKSAVGHTHDANSLTGTTLAAGVTASSLTSVGTLTNLTVNNSNFAYLPDTTRIGSTSTPVLQLSGFNTAEIRFSGSNIASGRRNMAWVWNTNGLLLKGYNDAFSAEDIFVTIAQTVYNGLHTITLSGTSGSRLVLTPSSATTPSNAPLNLVPHTNDPSSVANGDLWVTGAAVKARVGGATLTLNATAADVVGPASATDNALVRFDSTTGKLIKNSVGLLSDAGVLTGLTGLDIGTVTGITAAMVRIGGDVRVGGTIYANDFVLTGGSGSGVGIVLDNLDDVVIAGSSPGIALADGQVLTYDAGTSVWRNKALSTLLAIQSGGAAVASRQILNFIQGSNVTLTVADNPGSSRVDVTISATGNVSSVAGRTGAVTLTAADIAAGTFPGSSYVFTGEATVTTTLRRGAIAVEDTASLTTSATTANQVVMSHAVASVRSVKYQIQVTSGAAYQTTEVLVVHDGTTAYVTEYGTILSGANLATFNVDISGGLVRLLVTPVNAVTTIKVASTAITV